MLLYNITQINGFIFQMLYNIILNVIIKYNNELIKGFRLMPQAKPIPSKDFVLLYAPPPLIFKPAAGSAHCLVFRDDLFWENPLMPKVPSH